MTIAEVADRMSEHICEHANDSEKFGVVAYGIEIVLGLIVTCAIIIACGAAIGLFKETVLVLLAALIMKYIIGGPHLSGFMRCVGLSAVLVLLFAWWSRFAYFSELFFSTGLGLTGVLCILIYAPLMHFDNEANQKVQSRFRKLLAIVCLVTIFFLHLFLNKAIYTFIFSGFLLSILNISPIGIWLTNHIEKISNKGGESQ